MRRLAQFKPHQFDRAEVVKKELEDKGIESLIQDEHDIFMDGSLSLFVADDQQYDRARDILDKVESGETVPDGAIAAKQAAQSDTDTSQALGLCRDPRTRRTLTIEVVIMVLVAVGWFMRKTWWSLLGQAGNPGPYGMMGDIQHRAYWSIGFNIAFGLLAIYLLRRRAGSWAAAGLADLKWRKELFGAVLVFLVYFLVTSAAWEFAAILRIPYAKNPPVSNEEISSLVDGVWLITYAFIVAALFQAYLITRLKQLWGSTASAVLVSAILYAIIRNWVSPTTLFRSLATGLAGGIMFAAWRRLPRLIAGNAALNFVMTYLRP